MRVVSTLLVLCSFVVSACSPDLGTCDIQAAQAPIIYLNGVPFTEGQALIYQSCAGSQCHAAGATGTARTGAPHGLNFDVQPISKTSSEDDVPVLQAGISEVRDEAEALWRVIDSGSMPPGKAGERPDLPWTDKTGTIDMMLTALDLAEARDKARNWLACAAPIVAATNDAPLKDQVMGLGKFEDPGTPPTLTGTWSSVYTNVLSVGCPNCHKSPNTFPGQDLDLSSADVAYSQLVGKPSFSGSMAMCSGRTLVVANDCANSLLWQKLGPKGSTVCGALMPYGGEPISDSARKAVCDWINAGAKKD